MMRRSDVSTEGQDADGLAGAGSDDLTPDIPKRTNVKKLRQQVLDGGKQRLAHRRWLFVISMLIICVSLVSVLVLMFCRAMGEQHISDSVFIAFISAVMVQSFLLIRILAISLFPRGQEKTTQKVEKDEA